MLTLDGAITFESDESGRKIVNGTSIELRDAVIVDVGAREGPARNISGTIEAPAHRLMKVNRFAPARPHGCGHRRHQARPRHVPGRLPRGLRGEAGERGRDPAGGLGTEIGRRAEDRAGGRPSPRVHGDRGSSPAMPAAVSGWSDLQCGGPEDRRQVEHSGTLPTGPVVPGRSPPRPVAKGRARNDAVAVARQ